MCPAVIKCKKRKSEAYENVSFFSIFTMYFFTWLFKLSCVLRYDDKVIFCSVLYFLIILATVYMLHSTHEVRIAFPSSDSSTLQYAM